MHQRQQKQIPQQDIEYTDTYRPKPESIQIATRQQQQQQNNTEKSETIPRIYIEEPSDELKTGLTGLDKYDCIRIENYKYRNKNRQYKDQPEYIRYIKIEPKEGYCLKRIYVKATRRGNPSTVKYFVQTKDGTTTIATFTTNTDLYPPVKILETQHHKGGGGGGGVDTGSTTRSTPSRQQKYSKIRSLLDSLQEEFSKLTSTTRLQQQTNIRTQMLFLLLSFQEELLTFP